MNIPLRRPHTAPHFGWWSLDRELHALERRDGKSLRFCGVLGDSPFFDDASGCDQAWMHFDARLNGRRYPVMVRRGKLNSGSGPNRLVWHVDYNASARLGQTKHEYGRWHALDRLICDALLCWPELEVTGKRPAILSVTGGWYDGAWTSQLCRHFRTGSISHRPPERFFPEARTPRAHRWQYAQASRPASANEDFELLGEFSRAEPSRIAELVAALRPLRPHLFSKDRVYIPLGVARTSSNWCLSWIYQDEWLTTDLLQTAHSPHGLLASRWTFPSASRSLVGNIDHVRGKRINLSAWGSSSTLAMNREGMVRVESELFTSSIKENLREVVEEAIWHWRDCVIDLPGSDGELHRRVIAAPRSVHAERLVHYGGTAFTVPMRIVRIGHEGDAGHPQPP